MKRLRYTAAARAATCLLLVLTLGVACARAGGGPEAGGSEPRADREPGAGSPGGAYAAVRVWAVHAVGARIWLLAHVEHEAGVEPVLRLLTSGDGGETWQDVTPPGVAFLAEPASILGRAFGSNQAWLAGIQRGGPYDELVVARTADGGRTWHRRRLPVPEVGDVGGVYMDFTSETDGRLLVTSSRAAGQMPAVVFATADGGRTWERLAAASHLNQAAAPGAPDPGGHPTGIAFVDGFTGWITAPNHGDGPFEGYAVQWTHDGGATWAPQPLVPPPDLPDAVSANIYPPRFEPTFMSHALHGVLPVHLRFSRRPDHVVAYLTDDMGLGWRPGPTVAMSPASEPVFAFTGRSGVVLDPPAGVLHFADDLFAPGPAWRRVESTTDLSAARAIAFGLDTLWIVTRDGRLLRSGDGGRHWTDATPSVIEPVTTTITDDDEPTVTPDLLAFRSRPPLHGSQIAAGLERALQQPGVDAVELLETLHHRWAPSGGLAYAEADLDGDGSVEIVAALNGEDGDPPSSWPAGSLFVIHRQEGRTLVHSAPASSLPQVRLHAVADVTGDGLPEIVWSTTEEAAHSPPTYVWVARWQEGRLERLPGLMRMPSLHDADAIRVVDGQVVLRGGVIASAGAGPSQRLRTDRYRWVDGRMRLVDRRFEPSPYAYFHLIDGIVAESVGRRADAEAHYRAALESDRVVLPDWMVRPLARGESLPEEDRRLLEGAVRAFAHFRLGLLLLLRQERVAEAVRSLTGAEGPFAGLPALLHRLVVQQSQTIDQACAQAARWAEEEPGFLRGLNLPFGYARPRWRPEDLCALEVPGLLD